MKALARKLGLGVALLLSAEAHAQVYECVAAVCDQGWGYACVNGRCFAGYPTAGIDCSVIPDLSSTGATLVDTICGQCAYTYTLPAHQLPPCTDSCNHDGLCHLTQFAFTPDSCTHAKDGCEEAPDNECARWRCGNLSVDTTCEPIFGQTCNDDCSLHPEVCNGADDNCNGLIDEGLTDCTPPDEDPCKPGGPDNTNYEFKGDIVGDPPEELAGDPIDISSGGTVHTGEEISIPSTVTPFKLLRSYTSNPVTWQYARGLGTSAHDFVPTPFGTSPARTNSLQWWHSEFSFVHPVTTVSSGGQWFVRQGDGAIRQLTACAPDASGACSAQVTPTTNSTSNTLSRAGDGTFTYDDQNGQRYVYASRWQGTPPASGATNERYFLTAILNLHGGVGGVPIIATTIAYALPTVAGGTCPNPAGNDSGVPYISRVTTGDGAQLHFHYRRLPTGRTETPFECVLDHINLLDQDSGQESGWITYDYESGQAGLLVSARWTGTNHIETYAYDNGASAGFIVNSAGTPTSSQLAGASGQVLQSQSSADDLSLSYTPVGCGSGNTAVCTAVEVTSMPTGKVTTYGLTKTAYALSPITTSVSDACSGGDCGSVSSGTESWQVQQLSNGVAVDTAAQDKLGHWAVQDWAVASDANASAGAVELRASKSGALAADGFGAQLATQYTYLYGANHQQRVATERRPGVLNGGSATTTYHYDANNRLTATIRSGLTYDGAGFILAAKQIGVFYLDHAQCSGDQTPDPLSRTREIHGPCFVASVDSTDCDLGGPVPVTQYAFYPATPASNRANRLQRITNYTSVSRPDGCSDSPALTTTLDSYDALGNVLSSHDANGVLTTSAYEENLAVRREKAGSASHYAYDNGKLTSIRYPEGNSEVFCYRKNTTQGACSSAQPWTPQLQWKARSNDNGATWTERVEYVYWPDGTLRTVSFLDGSQAAPGARVRRVLQFKADAHRRPELSALGDTPGQQVVTRAAFDGANNRIALGLPFNSPPDHCAGGASVACAQMAYDAADRLIGLDTFPSSSEAGTRSCLQHDARGNVSAVFSGCAVTGAGGDCSQCPASNAARYQYDDFDNVVATTLPWTDDGAGHAGTTRYTYDATGQVTRKQTPSMTADGSYVEYAYDGLGRVLSLAEKRDAASDTLLYRLTYDQGTLDASCAQPSQAVGRLIRREDSFGSTWYQYDALGHVTGEVRLRAGQTTCTSASLHTHYAYSANGNLTAIRYPLGRTVRYGHGTGAATDRVTSVSVDVMDGNTWRSEAIVQSVAWEPYGGLRAYQIKHLASGTSSGIEYWLGGDASATPSSCAGGAGGGGDHTGRVRSIVVSPGALDLGNPSGTTYQRTYTWHADQIVRADTCLLGEATPHTETFSYDGMLRLTGAQRADDHVSTSYSYDGRGNRTSGGHYGAASFPDRLTETTCSGAGCLASARLSYDKDGRVSQRAGATDSTQQPAYFLGYTSGPDAHGGLDTVVRSVSVSGATYQYFYDAFNRRRLKEYPTGATDEFFYDTGHTLLVDRGNDSVLNPSVSVSDEYVWLGSRPLAFVRSNLDASGAHTSETAQSTCSRNNDGAACGLYFPISDGVGKPVLILDSAGRVANALDHEPFGQANWMGAVVETPHPYPADGTVYSLALPAPHSGPAGTVLDYRVQFGLLDLETDGSTAVDFVEVSAPGAGPQPALGGHHRGNVWTGWIPATRAGPPSVSVKTNSASCCPTASGHLDCSSACNGWPYSGVVVQGYEYQRHQANATPIRTPLRFTGQYLDEETQLFENWNRYYEPGTGRYLEPEPMAQNAALAGC